MPHKLTIPRVCQRCGAFFLTCDLYIRRTGAKFCSRLCAGRGELGLSRAERFWIKVAKSLDPEGCWIWTSTHMAGGYGSFWDNETRKRRRSSRVAWELTYGPIPDGLWVLHDCDNPPCVRPDHLYTGTQKRNLADMVNRGRHSSVLHPEAVLRGERHPRAKLTVAAVVSMRKRHANGNVSFVELAREHGVTAGAIEHAIKRETWKTV